MFFYFLDWLERVRVGLLFHKLDGYIVRKIYQPTRIDIINSSMFTVI